MTENTLTAASTLTLDTPVIVWLMGSDPAIRWQVLRDLLDAPATDWWAERQRVAVEGWGTELLGCADPDGRWDGGAYLPAGFDWDDPAREPGQPWTATTYVLSQLRELGIDPEHAPMRQAIALIDRHCLWECDDLPYWSGEVEECINGMTVANGAYFGVDVTPIVDRLLGERLPDGGWNCQRANGSVRTSFDTSINVLEGLLEFERATGGSAATREAMADAEEFLLVRDLHRRLTTGAPARDRFTDLVHPSRWFYTELRALEYFRGVSLLRGTAPDPRLGPAIERLRGQRLDDGRWPVDLNPTGRTWLRFEAPGEPSRWVTLRALRVLKWWETSRFGR